MRIIVCFKVTQDLESVMKRDWEQASLEAFDISYTQKELNCYDEAALEAALRLQDTLRASGEEAVVDAVTIGNGNYDIFYKNMFAVGVNQIFQIHTEEDLTWRPDAVAGLLAEAAQPYDAVFLGSKNAMGENGLTPYLLAGRLGRPCLNQVISVRCAEGGLRAVCERDAGELHATVRQPAVYAFGNSDTPYLRVATLREKLAVKGKKAEHLERSPEGKEGFRACRLFQESLVKECTFLEGESAEEKARGLLDTLRKEKLA
ncbi:MAG: hypothetical protein IJU99_04160 [Lachnospiraceae bacterium]|nr:hypothetical protein [Lachnospiraceae bacterium]